MSLSAVSAFVGCYLLITLLLANVLIYTPLSWSVKLGCCALVGGLFLYSYAALLPLLGWPTAAALPDSFNLVGVHVEEPEKSSHETGNIYLWITNKMAASTEDVPRAYALPYNSKLQARLVDAGNRLRKGIPQLGKIDETAAGLIGPEHEKIPDIEFYDEPEPLFPEK